MARRIGAGALIVLGILMADAGFALAQAATPGRGPRFLLTAWTGGELIDASLAPVLQRRVTLDVNDVTLDQALKTIVERADLEIAYSARVIPVLRRVSLHVADMTVARAMEQLLAGLPVDVSVTEAGGLAIVRRDDSTVEKADSGSVSGQVTDSATGAPIVGATVSVEGIRSSVITDAEGGYRLDDLPAGTHVIHARYIGYRPFRARAMVEPGRGTRLDIVLGKPAQELDQLVVTGTIVPTAVKALPTPVSVITDSDIQAAHPSTLQDVVREEIPGAVGWDFLAAPYNTTFSVRGASTLNLAAQMKMFIDGIEVAMPSRSPVDPKSIERIEVIRGPQAAAIYGSDAIGGVIQIFTKRGDSSTTRPQIAAQAGVGMLETPYVGFKSVWRQEYSASITGGAPGVGYNFGAAYSHTADYLPNGELSAQSTPSVYGGIRYARGVIAADVSGRYYTSSVPSVFNPELATTGYVFWSKPFFQPAQTRNHTLGGRFSVTPLSWWTHTITAGLDYFAVPSEQARPRLTSPGDTLLSIFNIERTKTSIGYNTSIQGALATGVTASLTAGFDHYRLPAEQVFIFGASNTSGAIRGGSYSVNYTSTTNTGYFAQGQMGFHDVLFLTGGARAERNSDFGEDIGTPLSPRLGISYVRRIADAMVKFRGSWGRSIRPPGPGARLASSASPTDIVLANPNLRPERQQGWDAGIDVALGLAGTLGITYYDQTADDLIDLVRLELAPVRIRQSQNAGQVKNRGVELEGTITLGPARLSAQYSYARARVERLAPNYAGDLRIGDQVPRVPSHTAGASLLVTPSSRTTISGGLVYVGSWQNYDAIAQYRCFGGTGPCQATNRDYIIAFPGFVKFNAAITHRVTPLLSAFLTLNNITNKSVYEAGNDLPVRGRLTTGGFEFHY